MGYTSVRKCIHIEIRTKFNLIHEKEWTGDTVSNICKRYCVSRKTYYKWKFPSDVAKTQVKKGIFSCDILLKPKLPGIDPIVVHAIDKNNVFDVDAIITVGIRDTAYIQGGRFPQ